MSPRLSFLGLRNAARRFTNSPSSCAVVTLLILQAGFFVFSITKMRNIVSPPPAAAECVANDPDMDKLVALYRKQAIERKQLFNLGLTGGRKSNLPENQLLIPVVHEALCPMLARVGDVGDGGKWMCNPWALPYDAVVYSLGSFSETSFETELQTITEKRARVFTVDMNQLTAAAMVEVNKIGGRFIKARVIAPGERAGPDDRTIEQLMLQENNRRIEILKIDIEGAEYTAVVPFIAEHKPCQIMIESHDPDKQPALLRAFATHGYYLFTFEINPAAYYFNEFSFIHKSCMSRYGATLLAQFMAE